MEGGAKQHPKVLTKGSEKHIKEWDNLEGWSCAQGLDTDRRRKQLKTAFGASAAGNAHIT